MHNFICSKKDSCKVSANWLKTVGGEVHTTLCLRTVGQTDNLIPVYHPPPPQKKNFVVGGYDNTKIILL